MVIFTTEKYIPTALEKNTMAISNKIPTRFLYKTNNKSQRCSTVHTCFVVRVDVDSYGSSACDSLHQKSQHVTLEQSKPKNEEIKYFNVFYNDRKVQKAQHTPY